VALGFSVVGQTRVMTAVSELARNIVQYAGEGEIELSPTSQPPGVEIVARDRGPGIPNLDRIMVGNYRSRLGMGLGLRGVKNLAERFDVRTEIGRGTLVSALVRVV
jgi:serine/threonine-protein kinase RsbT